MAHSAWTATHTLWPEPSFPCLPERQGTLFHGPGGQAAGLHAAERWTYMDAEGKKHPKDTGEGLPCLIHELPGLSKTAASPRISRGRRLLWGIVEQEGFLKNA